MRFTGELLATGGTTTGFEVPDPVVEALGGGGRPKVAVTVDGYRFRTSIARMGGRYLLGVSGQRRAESGMTAGSTYEVDLELDAAPREVQLPAELDEALVADADARTYFDSLSHSRRSRLALSVDGAKAEATRRRRVDAVMTALRERSVP
ncbi:YdeI/OmpD-associated family protein [Terracoccus luteus]|uniref:Bacteriocin resistance YdeI/OmpD-like protein n=1 Tax=Terracoccus luteus TaxID=53356 RepID=A0A839PQV6_9MICO|nr:YdeI/OmpD-associated family protein [Terracoccus luteus]MBB2986570.1 hypothetical protein [Terracoccus luteus]MCP2171841.1 hypothetical protein [Terracoccus luteus]